MSEFSPDAAARELFRARLTRTPCTTPSERYGIDSFERAYQVQRALLGMYRGAGQEVIGYKLGLTDQRAQVASRLDHPLMGAMVQGWQYWNADDIPTAGLIEPKVEAEVAFVMSKTVDNPDATMSDLLDSLGGALPALEVCDSAIQGWPRSLFDALADNLCSGVFVLGTQPVDPRSLDLATLPMTLSRDKQVIAQGSGAQCMGSPLNACLWLARERARAGTPLQAGDIVLSGALGGMQPVARGDALKLELGQLGSLSCRFV